MEYLPFVVAFYLVLTLAYFGRKKPGYSHIKHTISELAESGSNTEKQVSYLVFLPVGVTMGVMTLLVKSNEPAFLFSVSLAFGYLAASLFPIDSDAPFFGSWKNIVHNLSAGISYVLAMSAFEDVAHDTEFPYALGKFLIMAFLVSIYIPYVRDYRGLLQRIVEIAIFSGLISVI